MSFNTQGPPMPPQNLLSDHDGDMRDGPSEDHRPADFASPETGRDLQNGVARRRPPRSNAQEREDGDTEKSVVAATGWWTESLRTRSRRSRERGGDRINRRKEAVPMRSRDSTSASAPAHPPRREGRERRGKRRLAAAGGEEEQITLADVADGRREELASSREARAPQIEGARLRQRCRCRKAVESTASRRWGDPPAPPLQGAVASTLSRGGREEEKKEMRN